MSGNKDRIATASHSQPEVQLKESKCINRHLIPTPANEFQVNTVDLGKENEIRFHSPYIPRPIGI